MEQNLSLSYNNEILNENQKLKITGYQGKLIAGMTVGTMQMQTRTTLCMHYSQV